MSACLFMSEIARVEHTMNPIVAVASPIGVAALRAGTGIDVLIAAHATVKTSIPVPARRAATPIGDATATIGFIVCSTRAISDINRHADIQWPRPAIAGQASVSIAHATIVVAAVVVVVRTARIEDG